MRLVIIAIVTLVVGGGIVGFMLYQNMQPDGVPRAASARELAGFLAEEHQAVARASDPFAVTSEEEVFASTGVWIGRRMEFDETLFAPESGLQFIGARESQIPGPGTSAHLMFATPEGAWASVFLQQYRDLPTMELGASFTLAAPGAIAPILVWRPGGQIYYIVSEQPEAVEAVRQALEAPEPTGRYPR